MIKDFKTIKNPGEGTITVAITLIESHLQIKQHELYVAILDKIVDALVIEFLDKNAEQIGKVLEGKIDDIRNSVAREIIKKMQEEKLRELEPKKEEEEISNNEMRIKYVDQYGNEIPNEYSWLGFERSK